MPITPEQGRMARAGRQMTVRQLSDRALVSPSVISRFENDISPGQAEALARIARVFEARGVEFLNAGAPGVRLRPVEEDARD